MTTEIDRALAQRINASIATTIAASETQVASAIELLDSGATVPFVARYRKEQTGGLSDTQLRDLEERLGYLRDLEARRNTIIGAIDEQGKLDDALRARLTAVTTKAELEDLYLPYKVKRKTRGVKAIEAGLEPLADMLWNNPEKSPDGEASGYVNPEKDVEDTKAALDGARYILMERFAEDAKTLAALRTLMKEQGWLCSSVMRGKEAEGEKFQNYFDYQERLSTVPSHRALAMFRGRSDSILALSLKLQEADGSFGDSGCINVIARHTDFEHRQRAADDWRAEVINWTWKVKLSGHIETDLFVALREQADAEAIRVFQNNLQALLLAAPAGAVTTLGLDPGFRSGVKVAVVDQTGKLLDHTAIFPHQPQKQWRQAIDTISALCQKHNVSLIAIGNGTASRETDQFAAEVIKVVKNPALKKVVVSEAGASVYSASVAAEKEFPDLDVTIRGAISIARRVQDPLAELVKIDPKAIGVGQYQHDVSQTALARSLDATVEDCVNSVGVDLNTASVPLLTRVAGITPVLAGNIVDYRDQHGAFDERRTLNKVPRLGPKAFEQCAGFLRISNGTNPLDASGVHPEAYPVVKRMVKESGLELKSLMGDTVTLSAFSAEAFVDEQFGLPTVQDILSELDKPGRDPRPEFKTASFKEGVDSIGDLTPNQILEGQVTNVTNFGAFVDIGVHQDGLVHIASMSDRFVKDPHQVVKAGDIVKVKVMSVEPERKRISLSMRLTDEAGADPAANRQKNQEARGDRRSQSGKSQHTGKGQQANGRHSGHKTSHKAGHKTGHSAGRSHTGGSSGAAPSALALALAESMKKKSP